MDFVANYSLVYLRNPATNAGFAKNGLNASTGATHSETRAVLQSIWVQQDAGQNACNFAVNMTLPMALQTLYGAPGLVTLSASVYQQGEAGLVIDFDVSWFNKRPTR